MRVANKPASESAPGTHRPIERPLFEPPRIRSEEEGKRPTSWLEFFFDLVFVVAVDQLARRLQHGVTGHGALVYLALYGPVWWAWVGFVLYTDRFGTDDLSDRFMTLVQIGAALVIAAAATQATSDRAPAFAIAYGVFRLILAARYAIAAHYVREARRECTPPVDRLCPRRYHLDRVGRGAGAVALLDVGSGIRRRPAHALRLPSHARDRAA